MPELLSYDRTVELLHEVIAEKGENFVYREPGDSDACLYAHGDEPGCLVGQVLFRAGVPMEDIAALDKAASTDVASLAAEFERWMPRSAVDLLSDAQNQQDGGATWGYALEFALEQQIGERE
jgi:hypothetical protein